MKPCRLAHHFKIESSQQPMTFQLRCPVCQQPLNISEKGASCDNNHQFDRAKQGYFNLLQSHKKRSKNPGDDKMMVQARTKFLDSGHYTPVISQLVGVIKTLSGGTKAPVIFDAGCGEGYYTTEIQKQLPDSQMAGLDISKPAIVTCSKRSKQVEWLVGSVNDLPLMDAQVDIIISIFSRCDWQEFSRILKPGGHVIVLAPGGHHLYELRQTIYNEVRPYPVDKQVQELPESLKLTSTVPVAAMMHLPDSETILNLLAMTPHYWHVKKDQRKKLQQLTTLDCRLDMQLYTIERV